MKERLTGAIILVALLVLLIPELLSGPGSSAATATASNADGQQMRSYTIDLADDGGVRRAASVPTTQAPLPAVPESNPPATANAPPPVESSAPVAAPSEPPASAPPPSAPPARVTPPAESRVASAGPSAGGWAVQVGSFASRENAERLARELKGKGFESHVSESSGNGKRLWRVRVGPEPDRASAVALGARLRATGHPGSVTSMP